jgi:hypothetical protein
VGLASVEPTIVNDWAPSGPSTFTVEPIWTWSFVWCSSISVAFMIVGSTEARPKEGRISNESPVGRALLGRRKGEVVKVQVPAGDIAYTILAIS